ncbi:MAG: 16S rRNA (guanine(966)-N(2))-methyltransferase RsmD [Desulfonatronovibrio sp.]
MRIISGQYKGRVLKTCSGPGYRPATGKVRESVFSMLESRGIDWSRTRVLDVFAGSGSLAFECLSRGAEYALFIEKNSKACSVIRENISLLGICSEKVQVLKVDVLKFLSSSLDHSFDMIFVDPPYGKNLLEPTLDSLFQKDLLGRNGFICAEIEADLDFDPGNLLHAELIKDKQFGQTRILIWKKK